MRSVHWLLRTLSRVWFNLVNISCVWTTWSMSELDYTLTHTHSMPAAVRLLIWAAPYFDQTGNRHFYHREPPENYKRLLRWKDTETYITTTKLSFCGGLEGFSNCSFRGKGHFRGVYSASILQSWFIALRVVVWIKDADSKLGAEKESFYYWEPSTSQHRKQRC